MLQFSCHHRYPSGFELNASFKTHAPIAALVGPSGSGKSTILSAICGNLTPLKGAVALNSKTLLDTDARIHIPPEHRNIGVVFQDYLLFPHMSVESNLRYGAKRRPGETINFHEIIELLDIADLLKRSPNALSGGQRQRVALGRAILSNPELLLLDEPLTGVDGGLKNHILNCLRKALLRWNIQTLLVTHNHADVARFADQIIQMGKNVLADNHPTPFSKTLPTRRFFMNTTVANISD